MTDNPYPITYSINSTQDTPINEKSNDMVIYSEPNLILLQPINFKSFDCFTFKFSFGINSILFIIGLVLTIIGSLDSREHADCLAIGCLFLFGSIVNIFWLPYGSHLIIDAKANLMIVTSRTICLCKSDDHKVNITHIQEVRFKKKLLLKKLMEYV